MPNSTAYSGELGKHMMIFLKYAKSKIRSTFSKRK